MFIVIKKVRVQENWKFQEQKLDIIGEHVFIFN